MEKDKRIARFIARFDSIKSERSAFSAHWQDIADVLTTGGIFTGQRNTGKMTNRHIFDATGGHANELLSSGFFSLLTSPTVPWFLLKTSSSELNARREVQIWLDDVTNIMAYEIQRPQTGFTTAMHEFYLEYGAYGNATMFVSEKSNMESLLFNTLPLCECYYVENDEGFIDTLVRSYVRTPQQLIERFGEDNVSDQCLRDAHRGDSSTKIEVLHFIMPTREVNLLDYTHTTLPFSSIYIEKDRAKILSVAGFEEQPFMAARFYKLPQETYGYGPGTTALPDLSMLQEINKTTLRGAQKMVDPPLQMPDQGFLSPPNTAPGRMNYYRTGNGERIEPIITGGRPDLGMELIASYQNRVREIFFVDQLQLNIGPQMTATEVIQRTEEKQRLMGPVIGRASTELLSPLIKRCFGLLVRSNKIPPPPVDIEAMNGKISIVYTSPIFKAQEQVAANNIMRAMQVITPFQATDPTIMDAFHPQRIVQGVAELYNLNQKFLRTDKEIQAVQKQRAEQQAAATQAQQLKDAGSGINSLAQAGVSMGDIL